MVSAWLERKAAEQRQAARIFLKKGDEKASGTTDTASNQKKNTAVTDDTQEITAQLVVHHVPGGVVRGKVYGKKTV